MINRRTGQIDIELFHKILTEIKHKPHRANELIDSFSRAQFDSKGIVLDIIDKLELTQKSNAIIFGGWYGSILIPVLYTQFSRIVVIDLDDEVIRSAKNNLFSECKTVDFIVDDVFTRHMKYGNFDLVINTSCEHMLPMKEWSWWADFKHDSHFVFQSNNMDKIDGHINCVYSLDEFKQQLPDNFRVLFEDELVDARGTRYTLAGRIL